jgi:translation elongation factor Ts
MNWPAMMRRQFDYNTFTFAESANKDYEKQVGELERFFVEASSYGKLPSKETNLKFEAMQGLFDGKKTLFIHAASPKEIIESVRTAQRNGIKRITLLAGASVPTIIHEPVEARSVTVAEMINDKLAAIGEKIGITNVSRIDADYVASYIHGAYRIGVLVGFNGNAEAVGKDVAMQIAAMNPLALDPDSISEETVAREKAIVMDTMKADPKMAGKPDEMISKIADGKLNAFFKENTLLAQAFVKDPSKTVAEYVKTAGADIKVTEFKRVALG